VGKDKLKEAIDIFGRMQDELEEVCEKALGMNVGVTSCVLQRTCMCF
jgi:hypothetical protein